MTIGDSRDGIDHLLRFGCLCQKSRCTGFQRRVNAFRYLVGGEYQDAGAAPLRDLATDIDAVSIRELKIEDEEVRCEPLDKVDRLASSGRFADDVDLRSTVRIVATPALTEEWSSTMMTLGMADLPLRDLREHDAKDPVSIAWLDVDLAAAETDALCKTTQAVSRRYNTGFVRRALIVRDRDR